MRFLKAFLALSASGLLAILSSTMSKSPTLPLFAQSLGLSEGEIGLVAAASTIVGILVNFTAGALSDIYGRKRLLVAAGFFFASAPFLYLFVTDALGLALVRVYHGIATATFTPVAIAFIADMYRSRRGEMMGFFSSATMIGRLIAPILAGAILSLAGFREAYLACGVIGAAASISIITLPSPKPAGEINCKGSMDAREILRVLVSGRVVTTGVVMAVTYFAIQGLETFLPIYMEGLGIETWLIGAVFTIQLFVIMILKPYAGRISDRFGRFKMTLAGLVTTSLGIACMAFLKSYLEIVLSIIVFAVGVASTTASIPPLVSELVSEEKYGAAMGAMETIKDVGQALGPIFVGLILSYVEFGVALLMVSLILLSALPLMCLKLGR